MADLLYILTLVAFFVLMVVFVRWCERIVGKDDVVPSDVTADTSESAIPEEVLA